MILEIIESPQKRFIMIYYIKRFLNKKNLLCFMSFIILFFVLTIDISAHGVTDGDKGFIQESSGTMIIPFIYLGAKHMVTGYDHLLFLFGVIFFLYRLKDVSIYVTLFAVGHSITLLSGVLLNISINAYLIDAIIGFSIVYKALDNMGAYQRWFGFQPNTKIATHVFGLIHGFGLATKILEYNISSNGLISNLLAFNVGVELGQVLGLTIIFIVISYWRRFGNFNQHAYRANVALMVGGFIFVGYQMTAFFINN